MARPRKQGKRTKSGRLSRAHKTVARDQGTPELQAKRYLIVGPDGDPVLASSALGCLFTRGHLDLDQYSAGLEFGRIRCAVLGPAWPGNTFGLEASDERIADLERRYRVMVAVLEPDEKSIVARVCAFNVWPQWFFNTVAGLKNLPDDERERALLLSGLTALVRSESKPRNRPSLTMLESCW